MRKLFIAYLIVMVVCVAFLFFMTVKIAQAKDVSVTFGWKQVITPGFAGWKLWVSETPGGPYTQVDGFIEYVEEQTTYQWHAPVMTLPEGEISKRYFVINAWNTIGEFSANSNEAELIVDATYEPAVPIELKILVVTE